MEIDHATCHALIERAFARGRLEPEEDAAMRQHVRACDACRKTYERYGEAESMLYYPAAQRGLSPSQMERVGARLFEGRGKSSGWSAWPKWAGAAAGLAVAAAALLTLTLPADDGFRPRGASDRSVSPRASLRAVRVRGGVKGPSLSDLSTNGGVVRPGDQVAVLVTHLGGFERAAISLIDPSGGERVLVESTPLAPDVRDRRVAVVEVDDAWSAGPHRLRARFSGSDVEGIREVRFEVRARP